MTAARRCATQQRILRSPLAPPQDLGPLWRWTCRLSGPDGGRCLGSGLADSRGAASGDAVAHINHLHPEA